MGRNDNSRRGRGGATNRTRGERREKGNARAGDRRKERAELRDAERAKQFAKSITKKDFEENLAAIREFKAKSVLCEICGEQIQDIAAAIANRKTGAPVHFDCVIAKLAETEHIGQNDKITYIGQGKFAVLHFDNIHDMRHFTIKREIEWEERERERQDWRNEIAGLYSQVK